MVNSGTYDVRFLLKFDLTSLDTGTYYGNANLKLKAVAGDFQEAQRGLRIRFFQGIPVGQKTEPLGIRLMVLPVGWSAGCATAGVDYSSSPIGSGTAKTIGTTTH